MSLRFLQLSSNTRWTINRSRRRGRAEPVTSSARPPSSCHQLKSSQSTGALWLEWQWYQSSGPRCHRWASINLSLFKLRNAETCVIEATPRSDSRHTIGARVDMYFRIVRKNLNTFFFLSVSKCIHTIDMCRTHNFNRVLFVRTVAFSYFEKGFDDKQIIIIFFAL